MFCRVLLQTGLRLAYLAIQTFHRDYYERERLSTSDAPLSLFLPQETQAYNLRLLELPAEEASFRLLQQNVCRCARTAACHTFLLASL